MVIKHKYVLLAAAILAAAVLAAPVESAVKILTNRLTFKVESISSLRSPSLKPEPAAPVVADEEIVVFSSRRRLESFDLTGKRTQELKTEFGPVATPAVTSDRIFVGGDDGKFHCLERKTGKELWSNNLKSLLFSQPALTVDRVIFQTANDRVLALDPETGSWRWEYQHLRGADLAVAQLGPPLVLEEVMFIGLSDGFIMSMDPENGRVFWKAHAFTGEQFMDVDAPLEADEANVFAASAGGEMAALSRKTGKIVWRCRAGGLGGFRLAGEYIFLATDEPGVTALDRLTGKEIWSTKLKGKRVRFSDLPLRPVVLNDLVVVVTRGGKVVALDQASGKVRETSNYFTAIISAPVPVPALGPSFLAMDNQGIVRLWKLGM
jgi:outer membrane protein assembly factor BamB